MKKLLSLLLLAVSFSMPAHAEYRYWTTLQLRNVKPGKCANYMHNSGPGGRVYTSATLSFEAYDTENRNAKCWYFKGSLGDNRSQTFNMSGGAASSYGQLYADEDLGHNYTGGTPTSPPTRFIVSGKCMHDILIGTWENTYYDGDGKSTVADERYTLTHNSSPDEIISAKIHLFKKSYGSWSADLGLARCSAPAAR